MRALSLACGLCVLVSACAYNLPANGPESSAVLQAAQEVVQSRYPRAITLKRADHVLALGPPEALGNAKVRRQVAVWVRRNYTGAWEPVVEVRLNAELREPTPGAFDPEGEFPTTARPVALKGSWHTLSRQSHEETAIYDAVLAKLQG